MRLVEFTDILFTISYFLIIVCFVLLITSADVRRLMRSLRRRFSSRALDEESFRAHSTSESLYKPGTLEERRKEAIDYLVENYFETKKREEAYLKKLQKHGILTKWIYRTSRNLENAFAFALNAVVKPSVMALMVYSTALSMYMGIRAGPQIARLTETIVPHPFNYGFDVLILFPIGFLPGILSIILGYYLEKKRLERILLQYGIKR